TFREPPDLALRLATACARLVIANPRFISVPPADQQETEKRNDLIHYLEIRSVDAVAALTSPAAKEQFAILHSRNLQAIRNGDLLVSHLLTTDIRRLLGLDTRVVIAYFRGASSTADRRRSLDYPYLQGSDSHAMSYTPLVSGDLAESSTSKLGLASWQDQLL